MQPKHLVIDYIAMEVNIGTLSALVKEETSKVRFFFAADFIY